MTTGIAHRAFRGFTLVELLVALSLASILILAAHSAFRVGAMLWRHVEEPRPFEEQGRRILALFRSELAGLYFPNVDPGENPPLVYEQDRESGQWKFTFFTATPSCHRGLPPASCARVTYEYRVPDGHGTRGAIMIRRAQWVAGEKPIAEPTADILAEGLSACSIRLLNDKGTPYRIDKQPGTRPPAMVAVDLQWPSKPFFRETSRPVRFRTVFPVPVNGSLWPRR